MSKPIRIGSSDDVQTKYTLAKLQPLLSELSTEQGLNKNFSANIKAAAKKLGMKPTTVRRMVIRYWYFGCARQAFLEFKRGPKVGADIKKDASKLPTRRRGKQPRLASRLGKVTFVPDDLDTDEMHAAVEFASRRKSVTWRLCWIRYMKQSFAKRYPALYAEFLAGKVACPLTISQLRRVIGDGDGLSSRARSKIFQNRRRRSDRTLRSGGPGDVYELDATGGQIALVSSEDPTVAVGLVTIYLLIDRWSRYIVSVFLSLRPASTAVLRTTLRIAFTSRQRFAAIGFDTDDVRWPPGVVPAAICMDRGAEMISEENLKACVDGLRIDALILPPLTPDGKGIVERVNRTIKARMKQRNIKGVYAKHLASPQDRKARKQARLSAVRNLEEALLIVLEEVDDYNRSPHRGLEKMPELAAAGVPPEPLAAYLWGLRELTGAARPPFTDQDYMKLTMIPDEASLTNGELHWKGLRYLAANASAKRARGKHTGKSSKVPILRDGSFPEELYQATGNDWSVWSLDQAGRRTLQRIVFEEYDALSEHRGMVPAMSKNQRDIRELKNPRGAAPSKHAKAKGAPTTREVGVRESARVEEKLGLSESGPSRRRAPEPKGDFARGASRRQAHELKLLRSLAEAS
jgi:transposase InsO family protein